MNFGYYILLSGVIFILIELFGYNKYKKIDGSMDYFETSYFVICTISGLCIFSILTATVLCLASYKTEIVSKNSEVSEVIYETNVEGTPKFSFRYPDKQKYSTLTVIYKDDVEIPYVANIVNSDKLGLVKIKGIALILDSSFENYGNDVIYSSNKKENSNKLVYAR